MALDFFRQEQHIKTRRAVSFDANALKPRSIDVDINSFQVESHASALHTPCHCPVKALSGACASNTCTERDMLLTLANVRISHYCANTLCNSVLLPLSGRRLHKARANTCLRTECLECGRGKQQPMEPLYVFFNGMAVFHGLR